MIYLDYAASTPIDPSVREAMLEAMGAANPSSAHPPGRQAAALVEAGRADVAQLLGCQPEEVVLTSGATESNNLAILGMLADRPPAHVVSARSEHKAVIDPLRQLQAKGWHITWLSPGPDGRIASTDVAEALRADTELVSLMHVNNETGAINDIAAFGALCRLHGAKLHVDAAQSPAWLALDMAAMKVDLMSLAAHKFYGPKGVGVLYKRRGCGLQPRSFGGGQERGLRPGTHAVHQIAGLGAAARLALERREQLAQRVRVQRDALWARLTTLGGVQLNGSPSGSPHVLNVSFEGVNGQSLVYGLPGLALSTGSACSSSSSQPSYVLRALGRSDALAEASLRLSLGAPTTDEELDAAAAQIEQTVTRLRDIARLPVQAVTA